MAEMKKPLEVRLSEVMRELHEEYGLAAFALVFTKEEDIKKENGAMYVVSNAPNSEAIKQYLRHFLEHHKGEPFVEKRLLSDGTVIAMGPAEDQPN